MDGIKVKGERARSRAEDGAAMPAPEWLLEEGTKLFGSAAERVNIGLTCSGGQAGCNSTLWLVARRLSFSARDITDFSAVRFCPAAWRAAHDTRMIDARVLLDAGQWRLSSHLDRERSLLQ
jgi:hypothetical protein